VAEAGPLAKRIIACRTMADLAAAIRPPRPVIIIVKAGDAVDEQIKALCEVMDRNDIIREQAPEICAIG
jgi:6-phosphogluconate dehydrogenase